MFKRNTRINHWIYRQTQSIGFHCATSMGFKMGLNSGYRMSIKLSCWVWFRGIHVTWTARGVQCSSPPTRVFQVSSFSQGPKKLSQQLWSIFLTFLTKDDGFYRWCLMMLWSGWISSQILGFADPISSGGKNTGPLWMLKTSKNPDFQFKETTTRRFFRMMFGSEEWRYISTKKWHILWGYSPTEPYVWAWCMVGSSKVGSRYGYWILDWEGFGQDDVASCVRTSLDHFRQKDVA